MVTVFGQAKTLVHRRFPFTIPVNIFILLLAINVLGLLLWWFASLGVNFQLKDAVYWSRRRGDSSYTPLLNRNYSQKTATLLYRFAIFFHAVPIVITSYFFVKFRNFIYWRPQKLCRYCEISKVGYSPVEAEAFLENTRQFCRFAILLDVAAWICDGCLMYNMLSKASIADMQGVAFALHISNIFMLCCHAFGGIMTVKLPKAFHEPISTSVGTYCMDCLYPVKLVVD